MRIAIFQHTLNPTVLGWVRGLETRGHDVLNVIAYDTEPSGGWASDLDVTILPNTSGRTNRLMRRLRPALPKAVYAFASLRSVRAFLRERSVEVAIVKIYSMRNVVVLIAAASLRLRRAAWGEEVAPLAWKWRLLRCLRILPRRWFVTNDARPGGVAAPLDPPVGRMAVIPYSPEPVPDRTRAQRSTDPDGPVRVLVVAAFWVVDSKRPWWVLDAAIDEGLLDGRATFSFVGLGKSDSPVLEGLRQRVREHGAEPLVDIRLNVPFADMPAIYAAHDLLVLPSAKEQFGMAVPEAMSQGLAVVASDVVGCRGVILPDVTGVLFPVDDRAALGRALSGLVSDPARIRRMGAAGRDFIEAHGSSEVTAAMIERLIER